MRGFANDTWWMLIFRGLALLLFGVLAVIWPGLTLAVLTILFAIYVFIVGVVNIVTGIGFYNTRRVWFLTLLLGVIEIAFGVFVAKNPALTVATLVFSIGIIFILQGILAIVVAFSDIRETGMRIVEVIAGVLAIIAGLLVFRYSSATALGFIWVVGAYGMIVGSLDVAQALNIRETLEVGEAPAARVQTTSVRSVRPARAQIRVKRAKK